MKTKVMLDIDGVIADFYSGFGKYLNDHIGAGLDLATEPDEYDVSNWGPNIAKEDIEREIPRWVLSGGYADMPIYPGAKEFVEKLNNRFDVYVVTARVGDFNFSLKNKVERVIKNDTLFWFSKYGLPTHNIYFNHRKTDFCKDYGINIMIEDKLKNALIANDNGIEVVLVDRGWNDERERDKSNIYVSGDYGDVLRILETLG